MDYTNIIKQIKPSKEEKELLSNISLEVKDYINSLCKEDDLDAEAVIVGSQAKGTYLKGNSDVDIFIAFPLDMSEDKLKKLGLSIGYKVNDYFNGEASEHYASHPYITTYIQGIEIDIVPCYKIEDGSQLKSAVDRTILHTNYIQSNITEEQKDEILLLKKFMTEIGVYGSDFKVSGFAGYLCELLIIKYDTFENCLRNVLKWKYGFSFDLEDYGTSDLFDDPLIAIDPTDKNRNVAASLKLEKMCEFINASRNYLDSDNKEDYFKTPSINLDKNSILDQIKNRGSKFIVIKFNIPNIAIDSLHPQLNKTVESITTKLEKKDFRVFKSAYWTDEENIAIFIFEMVSFKLNNIEINKGPKIFIPKACRDFTLKHGIENCYVLDDFLVYNSSREFITSESYIEYIFTPEHISLIKVGKNLKKAILSSYEFINIDDVDLEVLYEFLNPSYKTKR